MSTSPRPARVPAPEAEAAASGAAGAPPRARPLERWWRWLRREGNPGIVLVLIALVAGFAIARPTTFATSFNARTLTADASTLLVLSVGLTFVVISAGIDLSIGSVLVFASVVSAKVMMATGGAGAGWGTILLGLLVGVACGLAWGLLNGVLIAKLRLPPLIVTLGTLGAALGAAEVITSGEDVREVPLKLATSVGIGNAFGAIPWIVLIAVGVALVAGFALAYTRFGRYTYAIGSNPEAARRVGIDVDRHLLAIYGLQGALAGLAGWLSLARFSTTTLAGHTTDNLSAIAAVVLGGTSLFGGVGTILGTCVGVLIPAVLQNGFVIVGLQQFWQEIAVGAVLIGAVYADQVRRRARDR